MLNQLGAIEKDIHAPPRVNDMRAGLSKRFPGPTPPEAPVPPMAALLESFPNQVREPPALAVLGVPARKVISDSTDTAYDSFLKVCRVKIPPEFTRITKCARTLNSN